MKKMIFGLLIGAFSGANAQVKIQEIYLQSGAFFGHSSGSLAEFQTLAPNSTILNQDLSLYENWPKYEFNFPGQSHNLSVGLKLEKFPKTTLRIGLMHANQPNLMQTSGSYTESFPYDTLTSSQTGEQFFIDSFSTHSYYAYYSQKQVRVDAALIFRFNASQRWSFFGGIGANFGLSYNGKTEVSQHVSPWGDMYNYGYYDYYPEGSYQKESFENKGGFGFGVYAPLGIDFQVGKNRDFWKPVHLFMELRPGFNVNQIASLGSTFAAGNFSNVGLRFKIN